MAYVQLLHCVFFEGLLPTRDKNPGVYLQLQKMFTSLTLQIEDSVEEVKGSANKKFIAKHQDFIFNAVVPLVTVFFSVHLKKNEKGDELNAMGGAFAERYRTS